MTPDEAAELLDRVIARADKLRAAGIRKVNLGVASFEFVPDETATATGGDEGEPADPSLTSLIAGTGERKERPPL
jgi:hypothetical protein